MWQRTEGMVRIFKARVATELRASAGEAAGFVELADQAEVALEHARRRAAEIIEAARDEAERLRRETEQQTLLAARRTVEAELRDEFRQRLETALPALVQAAAGVRHEATALLQQCEQHVLRLAIAIAQRIIRRELAHTPDIPLTLVREALELAAGAQRIELRVHPADHETLQTRYGEIAENLRGATAVQIMADAAVGRGGCVVRTECGTIDQRIASQLARIEDELTPCST